MMRRGFEHRVATVGGLVLLATIGGCRPWETDFDPPSLSQLVCTRGSGVDVSTMVFILDTGRSSATWANGPGAPRGQLAVTDYEYRLVFAPAASQLASAVTINRYDGVMERQVRANPSGRAASSARDAVRERWSCAPHPLKVKV